MGEARQFELQRVLLEPRLMQDLDNRALSSAISQGRVSRLLASLAAPAFSRTRLTAAAVTAVAAGGFLLSAYAIFARARFGTLLYGRITVPTVAPFGPFVSKNHFAGYVVMAALLTAGLALGLADSARGRGRDWTTSSRAGVVVLAMVAAVAMGLAFVIPFSTCLAMFLGSFFFWAAEKVFKRKESLPHRTFVENLEPVCAGVIAGGALMGVALAVYEVLK